VSAAQDQTKADTAAADPAAANTSQAGSGPDEASGEGVSRAHADLPGIRTKITEGGAAKYHQAAAASGKLFARERIALLVDAGSFTEDGVFANVLADGLPADGVITGVASISGRPSPT